MNCRGALAAGGGTVTDDRTRADYSRQATALVETRVVSRTEFMPSQAREETRALHGCDPRTRWPVLVAPDTGQVSRKESHEHHRRHRIRDSVVRGRDSG